MENNSRSVGLTVVLALLATAPFVVGARAAGQETILYNFTGSSDGTDPTTNLIFDSKGNMYGTAAAGGAGSGVVFELTPEIGGGWTETVLHSFTDNGSDGAQPLAGLVFDSAGNLYGTTVFGGAYNFGTVFELSPSAGGGWTETVLHSFRGGGIDGTNPKSGLILDGVGNIFGTTPTGGAHNGGTVFELTRRSGSWKETVLCSFPNVPKVYSSGPENASLVLDSAGNLYGTTQGSGAHDYGSIFELSPKTGGGWTTKILHSFDYNNKDGIDPEAGLILDSSGNLYGTTSQGGTNAVFGTVFELSPTSGGQTSGGPWNEKILYTFSSSGGGTFPIGSVVFDSSGNLYGTTFSGGDYNGGTVFELTPTAGGSWTWSLLYSLGNGADGNTPWGGVVFDSQGNLHGATVHGGTYGYGTVFEITP